MINSVDDIDKFDKKIRIAENDLRALIKSLLLEKDLTVPLSTNRLLYPSKYPGSDLESSDSTKKENHDFYYEFWNGTAERVKYDSAGDYGPGELKLAAHLDRALTPQRSRYDILINGKEWEIKSLRGNTYDFQVGATGKKIVFDLVYEIKQYFNQLYKFKIYVEKIFKSSNYLNNKLIEMMKMADSFLNNNFITGNNKLSAHSFHKTFEDGEFTFKMFLNLIDFAQRFNTKSRKLEILS